MNKEWNTVRKLDHKGVRKRVRRSEAAFMVNILSLFTLTLRSNLLPSPHFARFLGSNPSRSPFVPWGGVTRERRPAGRVTPHLTEGEGYDSGWTLSCRSLLLPSSLSCFLTFSSSPGLVVCRSLATLILSLRPPQAPPSGLEEEGRDRHDYGNNHFLRVSPAYAFIILMAWDK